MKSISASTTCGLLVLTLACSCAARAQPAEVELRSDNAFQAFGNGSERLRRMRERLDDPQQRMSIRAEQRARMLSSHRDIGEVLRLDATTEEKLIELATDLEMDRFDRFYPRTPAQSQDQLWSDLLVQAEQETQHIEKIRQLLGPEKLDRYQAYAATVHERAQVARFQERLDTPHKLNVEQRERLAMLYREHLHREFAKNQSPFSPRSRLGEEMRDMPSREELERHSRLQMIASNQASWRRSAQSNEQLRQQASAFLTAPQLAVFAQMQREHADEVRRWTENARVQAGLSPEIPARPEPAEQGVRTPVVKQVKLSIKVTVNRNEPIYFTHVGNNGEPVTFAAADGLLVQATPTLYDDDFFDVGVAYYEQASTGRRLIGHGSQGGAFVRSASDRPTLAHAEGSGTVITGRKGYAVHLRALIEAM